MGHKVAPGMDTTFLIKFSPDEKKVRSLLFTVFLWHLAFIIHLFCQIRCILVIFVQWQAIAICLRWIFHHATQISFETWFFLSTNILCLFSILVRWYHDIIISQDYTHELVCMTEREKFLVPIKAIGARAILDFPDDVNFASCPVKVCSVTHWNSTNSLAWMFNNGKYIGP